MRGLVLGIKSLALMAASASDSPSLNTVGFLRGIKRRC